VWSAVSTAAPVPQTALTPGHEFSTDKALATLRLAGPGRLLRDAFIRFRYGDGFSHARALALQTQIEAVRAGASAPTMTEEHVRSTGRAFRAAVAVASGDRRAADVLLDKVGRRAGADCDLLTGTRTDPRAG